MSAGPELNPDLVAVACVVEASLILASEWSRVLIEYVHPLLKRLHELHPSHQFRLAFVTYGAADTRPLPLLSKRFFAPLAQVTKELREEPSKFGIGQINVANSRGLSALEGFVAAIELFDILMASAANHAQAQSPQKESRSLIFHLFHIAASPPDNSQRPQCNTLQHLDSVSWDSIPNELKKRKINLSLISLRKLPQFQDLQSSVAGSGAQSPWFSVHTPHTLLLCGFPTPQKTGAKRQTDTLPSEQSPEAKRIKVESLSKTSSGSTSAARTPPNQRTQQASPSQGHQLPSSQAAAPAPNPPSVPPHPNHPTSSVSQPVPAVLTTTAPGPAPPSAPLPTQMPPAAPSLPGITPELLEQVVSPAGIKFGQMMERLKGLEKEITTIEMQMTTAQNTGQTVPVAGLQKDRAQKIHVRDQIKILLRQYYQKMSMAKDAQNGASGSNPQSGSAMAGPSTQTLTSNVTNGMASSSTEEHKPQIPDSQVLVNFWQSRGGNVAASNASNAQPGSSQAQPRPPMTPEVAAQMQKLIDKKGIRPQTFGLSAQTSTTAAQETSDATNTLLIQPTLVWQGSFLWTFPQPNGQASEMQLQVVGSVPSNVPGDVNTDGWPNNISLVACKQPMKDNTEILAWLKRHQFRSRILQFRPTPRVGDTGINEQRFHALNKLMTDRRICAYAGWRQPSGKFMNTFFIFPLGASFAGAFFVDGLPELPGTGNTLESPPSIEQPKPQSFGGINIPPAVLTRLQGLDPAQQKQLLAHFVREQMLRRQQQQQQQQQSQQNQQPRTTGQDLTSLGVPYTPDSYNTVGANVPGGFYANSLGSINNGAYNPGPSGSGGSGGTVNYEMLQSFMQRTADGSIPQGLNPG